MPGGEIESRWKATFRRAGPYSRMSQSLTRPLAFGALSSTFFFLSGVAGLGASGCAGGGGGGVESSAGRGGTIGAAGTTGSAGTTGAAGTVSSGGSGGITATAGSGGTTATAGSIEGGGGSGGQTGGAAGSSAAGSTGAGGSRGPHGSAAKFVCAPGATYGNPLTGMGAVTTIAAPSSDHFMFIEGPLWSDELSALFFSDNGSMPERIFKLVPPAMAPALFVSNSGSNGLALDNSGRLTAADQRNKAISRFDPMTGQIVGTPISTGTATPNDVIVRSDDNVYFTDPDTGFYRISPDGTVSAAMKLAASNRPNGIELSLDEGTLYVGDVGNRTIARYTLAADGTVMMASGRNLVPQTMNSVVDGMCTDCAGNIYAGTSGGIEVYSSAGTYIGTVPTGSSSNCTFGGPDHKTLYVTSRTVLKSVTLAVPGLPD